MRTRVALVALVGLVGCAGAQPSSLATKAQLRAIEPRALPPSSVDPLPAMSDQELAERTAFLERAIARNARDQRLWHGVWTTGYALGMAVESTRAVWADEEPQRVSSTVGAAKAAIGVAARLARPVRAVYGPTPADLVPETDRAGRARRMMIAETMLRIDAHDTDRRFQWIGHTLNVGLNFIGFLIIGLAAKDGWAQAGESLGVGVLVGELSVWSQPYRAKKDWRRYVERWGGAAGRAQLDLDRPSERPRPLLGLTF